MFILWITGVNMGVKRKSDPQNRHSNYEKPTLKTDTLYIRIFKNK